MDYGRLKIFRQIREILFEYVLTDKGTCISPGKFENEPIETIYFHKVFWMVIMGKLKLMVG